MSSYVCANCGFESNKWIGKCPACNEWNSFKEVSRIIGKKNSKSISQNISLTKLAISPISEIVVDSEARIKTGINEFDCVLGGGIVPGMVILLGGEPGTGKSTLMLQLAKMLSLKDKKILYVSGEESSQQIKIRSDRLNTNSENILLMCCNQIEQIEPTVKEHAPDLLIVDSIQSVYSSVIDSYQGSVTQLRECSNYLTKLAKNNNIPTIIIGHVTKDGVVAGPKTIEHMVDTVLYFESDKSGFHKILRTSKNRFGSTNEIGIFEMTSNGLNEAPNPSMTFISTNEMRSGDVISCISEGSRNFFIEIQALLNDTNYGNAQRVAVGYEQKKLAMILAVIEKNTGIPLGNNDVFINIIGGLKIKDSAIDLAVVASIFSGFSDIALSKNSVFIGEVGLNGEVRTASNINSRINESLKLGFKEVVLSKNSNIDSKFKNKVKMIKDISELFKLYF